MGDLIPQTFPAPCPTAARHLSQHNAHYHFQYENFQLFCLKPILQTHENWRNSALSSCKQPRQSQCWGQRGKVSLQGCLLHFLMSPHDLSTRRHCWTRAKSCLQCQGLLHTPRTCHRKSLHVLTPENCLEDTRASTSYWHGQDASVTGLSLGSKSCLCSLEKFLLVVGNSQDQSLHLDKHWDKCT